MKKIISLILSFLIILPTATSVMATGEYAESVARVSALGIMGNVADGDFREDDNITRAEFTTVVCRILGLDNRAQTATVFTDVPAEHWASGYISMAYSMGLVNGKGDGTFDPEADVTFPEAAKILVCAAEYDLVMTDFTYPNSYLAMASKLGITSDVKSSYDAVTRAEVAKLIDNVLDVKPIEPIYGSENYEISSQTLGEKFDSINDSLLFSGVLETTQNLTIIQGVTPEDGTIIVDGRIFATEENLDKYLGMYINVYYKTSSGMDKLVGISPDNSVNKTFSILADDAVLTASGLEYYDENDKEKELRISGNAKFVLNGDPITNPTGVNVILGSYTLLNNTADNAYDVVFIHSAQSFIVENINETNTAIFFKDNKRYMGKDGFAFDFEDEDKTYIIQDKAGKELSFFDIKPGDSVTIESNSSSSYVKLTVNSEIVSGNISEISSNSEIYIGDKSYHIGKDALGNLMFTPYLDLSGNFVIDAFGYCIGLSEDVADEFMYGYIADAGVTGSLDSSFMIKVITGTEPKKEVKTVSGDETIYYHLQNDDFKEYTLAESISFATNPTDTRGTRMSVSNITPDMVKGKIAGFTLDSQGKVKSLNVYTVPSSLPNHDFNASIFSFGGINVTRGFIKGANSQIICIPDNPRTDDDYMLKVTLTDASQYKVYGIKGRYVNEAGTLEAYSEPVDVIILKTAMDSSLTPSIPVDNDICIIGKVNQATSGSGDEVYKVELLNGSEKMILEVPGDSLAYSSMATLRKGDLIQYVTNSKEEITAVRKLASVQGLTGYTDAENIYGLTYDVKYNMYDYYSNEIIDLVNVNVGTRVADVKIFKDEGQNIYLYDRKSGYIYPATTDDIKAEIYYGDKATKFFAYMEDNDAKVVVLITD